MDGDSFVLAAPRCGGLRCFLLCLPTVVCSTAPSGGDKMPRPPETEGVVRLNHAKSRAVSPQPFAVVAGKTRLPFVAPLQTAHAQRQVVQGKMCTSSNSSNNNNSNDRCNELQIEDRKKELRRGDHLGPPEVQ